MIANCNCTLQPEGKPVCDGCPYLASAATPHNYHLPIPMDEYSIDFGDDYILLRKKK